MRAKTFFLSALMVLFMTMPVMAVEPGEILKDPALEARAREVGRELRCLVCQNQSIDDSDADLARDLRVLVRDRIVAGDSNDEVIDYVVSRYGDFVLLNPPFKLKTYVLWFGPAAFIIFGVFILIMFYRRKAAPGEIPQALSDAEKEKLLRLMDEDKT